MLRKMTFIEMKFGIGEDSRDRKIRFRESVVAGFVG
jgi:hypothetical protein